MVTSEPVGLCESPRADFGMSGTASGNSSSKNRRTSASVLVRGETARAFEFPEERAGERAVGIRERDHHETFARPDVERLLFHLPSTIGRGRDGELLVAVGEITLVVLELCELFLHRLAHGRESAIDADDRVSSDDYLIFAFAGDSPSLSFGVASTPASTEESIS